MSLVLCTIIHCLKHQVHKTSATLNKKSPNLYQVGFSFLWLWGRINQYHQYQTCVYIYNLAWKDNRTDAKHKPTSAGQLRGVAQKCKYHKISQDHVIMSFSQWLSPKQSYPVMPCRANNRFEKRETSKLSAGAQVLKRSFRPVATDHDFPRDVAGVNDLDTIFRAMNIQLPRSSVLVVKNQGRGIWPIPIWPTYDPLTTQSTVAVVNKKHWPGLNWAVIWTPSSTMAGIAMVGSCPDGNMLSRLDHTHINHTSTISYNFFTDDFCMF